MSCACEQIALGDFVYIPDLLTTRLRLIAITCEHLQAEAIGPQKN